MNWTRIQSRPWCICLLLAGALSLSRLAQADTNIFFTQFEKSEGYTTNGPLVGQNGWTADGAGGNGIVTNFFAGQGQQAFIGFSPPTSGYDYLAVWKPINYTPLNSGNPVVKFSVLMGIADSSVANGNYDNFRWSLYNTQSDRLFSLDFDNSSLLVNYLLDGTNDFVATGLRFTNGVPYNLTITMNFPSNRWSATLDTRLIATNQPITTVSSPLNFGDMDAVWLVYDTNAPGDNYMLFDNLRVTAAPLLPAAPRLQFLGKSGSQVTLRLFGDSGWRFAVDATTNLTQWTPLKTNIVSDGSFDLVDTAIGTLPRRYYRARFVP